MSNERDTKFAGFAKALWDEVLSKTPRYDEISLILARRAYDLVEHACETIEDKEADYDARMTSWYMLTNVPDMPELPEEEQHE